MGDPRSHIRKLFVELDDETDKMLEFLLQKYKWSKKQLIKDLIEKETKRHAGFNQFKNLK